MSTKRLSKTVIEGGRQGRNKWERRNSHAENRAEERDYLKAVTADPELAEEMEIGERQHVMKDFTDKLAPMYRWIDSQVGRPWGDVRSEIFQKFDTRTTAGRHITFDHLLREIVDTESGFDDRGYMANPNIPVIHTEGKYYFESFADYYVDQDGILRSRKRRRNRYRYQPELVPSEQNYKDAEAWLQNRMVLEKDGKLYWGMPTEGIWLATWFEPHKTYDRYSSRELFYFVRDSGNHKETYYRPDPLYKDRFFAYNVMESCPYWKKVENPFSFRQRGELSTQDIKTFRSFKSRIRKDILSYSKGR